MIVTCAPHHESQITDHKSIGYDVNGEGRRPPEPWRSRCHRCPHAAPRPRRGARACNEQRHMRDGSQDIHGRHARVVSGDHGARDQRRRIGGAGRCGPRALVRHLCGVRGRAYQPLRRSRHHRA